MVLSFHPARAPGFHPLVAEWFEKTFGAPTPPQEAGWAKIASGSDTLIAAPTGSGKTLAAFFWWINQLVELAVEGKLEDRCDLIYVSPLKALGNDIQKNLQVPLEGIRELAAAKGVELPEIRVAVRSGDTPASDRERMIRRPPHILVTTPESLYILLTAERSRNFLKMGKAVIVDEIHAVAGDKRGSHLALSLERLDLLAGRRLQRIGLSATQKPIEEIAQLLVGTARVDEAGKPLCEVVDVGHRRGWELSVEVPGQPLGPIATHELRGETYDRIVQLVKEHRTTIVFVNTRRLVERLAHELTTRLGEGKVAAHHGSLSKKIRLEAERGLKSGEVPVVVATASLELGIDVGHVDLVVHLGAPRALATMLQRVGRSGHWLGAVPKGILFPMTRDELVQCAAAVRAARAGELDHVIIPEKPLDILAQQIVAIAATAEISESELWDLVRRAYPYRDLEQKDFEDVVQMHSEGVANRHGRRTALLHRDRINGVITGRRGARLASITSGGAIPDVADYDVIVDPEEILVGKVNEDFAIESMAGDIFLLGNSSWRIRRIEAGKVRVEDAHGLPPSIPFWTGEAPARTIELSTAVSDLRQVVADGLDNRESTVEMLMRDTGVDREGAEQIFEYIAEIVLALGTVPTQTRIVAERFFDEAGGMQLIVHAPFGARINRAWGLSLRKRFCVTFDFELQAAATDDGICLSLGEQHSFPLESTFNFVRTNTIEDALVQSALASPMFGTRWRWNATRSLALLRFSGGRKVPMPIQRMRSDDLLSAVFPDQVACQEERMGPILLPDHPLVNETILNCLHEVMDLDGARELVGRIERREIETVSIETPAPSPASHEILNANPYAFLDDAPLEERRARAVSLRRIDPELAQEAGSLDPAAIAEVAEQARPDVRDAHELHDLLLSLVLLPLDREILPSDVTASWSEFALELIQKGRATVAAWQVGEERRQALVAAENTPIASVLVQGASFEPAVNIPAPLRMKQPERDEAFRTCIQGWAQVLCPLTHERLAEDLGLDSTGVEVALISLEGSGMVLRGSFTPGMKELEWCDRRLLARVHRLTINRLRREIVAVSPSDFMRFLLRWQHVHPGTKLHGREGVQALITQLEGLELPAPAWESHILPARVARYDRADLEYLCLSGVVAWGRLRPSSEEEEEPVTDATPIRRRQGPTRTTPIGFFLREDLPIFTSHQGQASASSLSTAAQDVFEFLTQNGASFQSDIVAGTKRLPTEVEDALWELVSAGLVTGDGIAGLRSLLDDGYRKERNRERLRIVHARRGYVRPLPVGRWSLWRKESGSIDSQQRIEALAKKLLKRYGVIFRELLVRERGLPSWRVMLDCFRRLEMRGEIRGGRFVSGFIGEQYALPEAVESLRAVRRTEEDGEVVIVNASDPLNLVGVVLPGGRISRLSGLSIAYRNGVVVDTGPLGTILSRLRASGDIPVTAT